MLGGALILPQETAFVSTLFKPIICSALFEFVSNRNRAEQELFKKPEFILLAEARKKGFACLCLIRSVLHYSKASSVCEPEKVMVGYKSSRVRDLGHRKI